MKTLLDAFEFISRGITVKVVLDTLLFFGSSIAIGIMLAIALGLHL